MQIKTEAEPGTRAIPPAPDDADAAPRADPGEAGLRPVLGLGALVFYGLGVTIGAGIFALLGEVVGLAGDYAPLAFLLAGLLAAVTARSYARLAARFPQAAGSAVYTTAAFGALAGRITGVAVAATGIVSAAVVSLAFGGYLAVLLPVPIAATAVGLVVLLALVAWLGVRQSIALATVITLIEVGTLAAIAGLGAPDVLNGDALARAFSLPAGFGGISLLLAGAALAFFAFLGFEDIVNMAEETVAPKKTVGRAIWITLLVSTALYLVLALVAISLPDRAAFTSSTAPMAAIVEAVAGWPAAPIAAIAAAAMVNGVLVQIMMASRVLFGMARQGLLPAWLGAIDRRRRTPARATLLVAAIIVLLAALAPLVTLAQATSYITLAVFTLVNLSLWRVIRRERADGRHARGAAWGLLAGATTGGLLVAELMRLAWS